MLNVKRTNNADYLDYLILAASTFFMQDKKSGEDKNIIATPKRYRSNTTVFGKQWLLGLGSIKIGPIGLRKHLT
jgi:hypothetical protein